MLRLLTDISKNHDEYVNQDEYLYAGVPMDYVSEINAYVSRDVEAENPFQATDAFLAEVRAHGRTQGIYFVANRMLAAWEHVSSSVTESEVIDVARMILSSIEMLPDAEEEDFEREFADEMMGVLTDLLRGNSNGGAV
ncbi:ead/Ea22-like family protein [Atlantibacter hermannii]|uniref:ead/Ea22-like family protein n=1 Tax=Atlantibacter hermannii TaxID=565 RepID=UPI0028AF94B4|nr:ead/Ea22-like family protein [Atlantibacter hermannii]